MPFRLRHQQHNFELVPGDFLIGREPQCQLVLDDPLVSRKHAKLVVSEDSVKIHDLGSRNGVAVNGSKIDRPVVLSHGDRIVIGTQEMMLIAYLPPGFSDTDHPSGRFRGAQTLTAMAAVTAQPTPLPPTDSKAERFADSIRDTASSALPTLSSLAEKALGLGRIEEAERILSSMAAEILKSLQHGESVSADTVDAVGQHSVRLAALTGKAKWVDSVVAIYTRAKRPFSAAIIDELHGAIRKIEPVDVKAFRAYVAVLREKAAAHGPAERFLVQRIESLERLAALR